MEKYNVIGKSKEALEQKASELGIDTTGLDYNGLKTAISNHLNAKASATPEKAAKKEKTILLNNRKVGFSRFTPSAFNYDGESRTQAEWLKDKDAMAAMVADGCVYVEIKN